MSGRSCPTTTTRCSARRGRPTPAPASRCRPPDIVNRVVNDPFKALSHPIRRGIVERLAEGPATVGDATRGFGVSKPAISKHLRVLEDTGVVTRVIDGRHHRLSLHPAVLTEAADWMDRQRAVWGRLFDVVDEYLKEMPPDEPPSDRLSRGVASRPREAAGKGEGGHAHA